MRKGIGSGVFVVMFLVLAISPVVSAEDFAVRGVTSFPVGSFEYLPFENLTTERFERYTGIAAEDGDTIDVTFYYGNGTAKMKTNVTVEDGYINLTIANYTTFPYEVGGYIEFELGKDKVDVVPLYPLYDETIVETPVKGTLKIGDWEISVLAEDKEVEVTTTNASGNKTTETVTYEAGETLYITDGDDEFYIEDYGAWFEDNTETWYNATKLVIQAYTVDDGETPVVMIYNYGVGEKTEGSAKFYYNMESTSRRPALFKTTRDVISGAEHTWTEYEFGNGSIVVPQDVARIKVKSGLWWDYKLYVESTGDVYIEKSILERPKVKTEGMINGLSTHGTVNGIDFYVVKLINQDEDDDGNDITVEETGVFYLKQSAYTVKGLLREKTVDATAVAG